MCRSRGFPRSAAGVVALYSAGIYDGEEIRRGLEYLRQFVPHPSAHPLEDHFFYGHYYAVQAMWHSGADDWRRWYPAIRDTLLARRRDDGSWFDQICPEYGTAMACLILQMPQNYLPIFQRYRTRNAPGALSTVCLRVEHRWSGRCWATNCA